MKDKESFKLGKEAAKEYSNSIIFQPLTRKELIIDEECFELGIVSKEKLEEWFLSILNHRNKKEA